MIVSRVFFSTLSVRIIRESPTFPAPAPAPPPPPRPCHCREGNLENGLVEEKRGGRRGDASSMPLKDRRILSGLTKIYLPAALDNARRTGGQTRTDGMDRPRARWKMREGGGDEERN